MFRVLCNPPVARDTAEQETLTNRQNAVSSRDILNNYKLDAMFSVFKIYLVPAGVNKEACENLIGFTSRPREYDIWYRPTARKKNVSLFIFL